MQTSKIAVSGATGTVGSLLVQRLVKNGHTVRAIVRDLAKAKRIFGDGVELLTCDLGDSKSIPLALEGVEKAFLLTGDIPPGEEKIQHEANFVEAVSVAGVKQIVYLSVFPHGSEPEFAFRRWHQETERRIEASGVAWTHLRPIAFMSNLLLSLEEIKSGGVFHLPTGDGRLSAIDPADIAEIASRALTENGHERKAYTLTGPEALTFTEQATQLSLALGREVRFVDVSADDARKAMNAILPLELTEALIEFYGLIKTGERAFITPDFEQIIGRKPNTFAFWAKQNAKAFA